PACVLFAGAIAALAYQAVDYPLEQFRALLYSEVASGEVMQQAVARHFPYGSSSSGGGGGVIENGTRVPELDRRYGRNRAQITPYRTAWKTLVDTAVREYPHSVQSNIWKRILAVRYLYRGWLGVSLRSIPAASVGLVVYELLKSSL
ncbi:hypothetical protein GGI05_003047, partial [Coemansia sp. RSA 2603]